MATLIVFPSLLFKRESFAKGWSGVVCVRAQKILGTFMKILGAMVTWHPRIFAGLV
jgi:hypothetical protein